MKIQEILKKPEGKTLEFKHDISSLKPILKSLVAFANTAGGILIVGPEILAELKRSMQNQSFDQLPCQDLSIKALDVDKVERIDISGSVLNAIDKVPRFIRRNTRLASKIETMHRKDISEYPDLAIREILVPLFG